MQTLEPYLAEHPFLKGLEPEHIKTIAECASNVRFDEDQFIFHEGEEANNFYIILNGKVSIELFAAERGTIRVQTIGEGEILGWSWLIPPYRWHFDTKVIEVTRAIALNGKCLRTKCENNHNLGYELLKRFTNIIAQRLEATRLQLLDIYGVHR